MVHDVQVTWFDTAQRSETTALTSAPVPPFQWQTGNKSLLPSLATAFYRSGKVTPLFSFAVFGAALCTRFSPGILVDYEGPETAFWLVYMRN